MTFQLGKKTRKQFSNEVDILYLIKNGIIQICPDRSNETCSDMCPFFTYERTTNKLKLECRPKTILVKIEGEHEINEC